MLNAWSDLVDGKAIKRSREYTEEELRAAFDAIDTNKSGNVSFTELKTAISAINPHADDTSIESMLAFADEDGDMEVSFEEFTKIMRGGRPSSNASDAAAPAALGALCSSEEGPSTLAALEEEISEAQAALEELDYSAQQDSAFERMVIEFYETNAAEEAARVSALGLQRCSPLGCSPCIRQSHGCIRRSLLLRLRCPPAPLTVEARLRPVRFSPSRRPSGS